MTGALQDCQRILARIQREQAAEEQAKQDEDQAEILKVQNSISLDGIFVPSTYHMLFLLTACSCSQVSSLELHSTSSFSTSV